MACLSLLISTAIGLSCAVSLPPNLQLAQSLHPNITTTPSTTHLLTTWPPAPFTYAFHGLTIDISAYALHTPPRATNPILLNLIAIQNEIYIGGRPNDRFLTPLTLSNGAVKLYFYPHGRGWITRRQAAQVPDALWDLTFSYGVRGISWAGIRVGDAGEGAVSAVKVNLVVEILEPGSPGALE